MFNYLFQRLATIVPTLFFVSILIFGLQQLLPGDPAVALSGEDRDPNVIAYLHQKLHLDEPLPVRDRKTTRLNSSHQITSYAVFCLKRKTSTEACQTHGVARADMPLS